jgi:hypothetical protein
MTQSCRAMYAASVSAILVALSGCLHGSASRNGSTGGGDDREDGSSAVPVELPWDASAVRDDEAAPIVKVDLPDGKSPVPYLYGYPIYAAGSALDGIRKLRQDNWTGVEREESEDSDGVVHVVERFPELACTFEGIKESAVAYVPWQLSCELPAPKRFGGKKRPVVGALDARATPAQVVKEPSLARAFLEDWHLAEEGLERGTGTGYFNTDHGQLGFEFEKGHLARVVYLFDAPEKRWRKPELWVQP